MSGLPKKYAKMGFKEGWKQYKQTNAYKRKAGKPVRKSGSSRPRGRKMAKSKASKARKFTVGTALDIGAFSAAGIHHGLQAYQTGEMSWVKSGITSAYTAYDPVNKKIVPKELIKGYGPSVIRAFEKKLFKAFGVQGPRTQISTVGDVIDMTTYFGKTAMEVYENRADPAEAARQAIITQYGIDMRAEPTKSVKLLDIATEKWLPYIAQKKVRQVLRGAGIKIPSFKLGG